MQRRSFLQQAVLLGSGLSDFEKRIPEVLKETKTPGLSIAVVQAGRLAWSRGYGNANPATVFQAASMSKPVFAYAVMKLCERGKITLDTPLTRYTRERFLAGDPRLDRITARHVLSHSSGFQNSRSGDLPLKIHFNPGEKWMYSGEGFAYLQSVVTHLTGKVDRGNCAQFEAGLEVCATNFEAYMKTNVLDPLGMKSSSYSIAAKRADGPAIARYGAMGGLLTTPSDYAKFLIAMMKSPAGIREMFRPQVEVEQAGDYKISWGLGWRIAQSKSATLVGHGGDNPGYHCLSQMNLERKSAFVMMTNSDGGVELLQRLAPALARQVVEN